LSVQLPYDRVNRGVIRRVIIRVKVFNTTNVRPSSI